MNVVADASVALKWFLASSAEEEGADLALSLLESIACGDVGMMQPPHFLAEVAAVLARLKPLEAEDDLLDLQDIEQTSIASPEIYATALALAVRYQHHLFDTLYHAVALHTPNTVLVTADRRYYDKAVGEGRIVMLEAWTLAGGM